MALQSLLMADSGESAEGAIEPHFAPRAKRLIWLFMHGGPSHVDLFDPKPDLSKYAGREGHLCVAIDGRGRFVCGRDG